MKRCRNSKGRFTKCRGGATKRRRKGTRGVGKAAAGKGRCLKWSKGRTRCVKRAKSRRSSRKKR